MDSRKVRIWFQLEILWDLMSQTVKGSCADTHSCSCPNAPGSVCKYNGMISPRIFQVIFCAPTESACAQGGGGPSGKLITPVNILSFFMTDWDFMMGQLTVHAVVIGGAGTGGSAGVPAGASFLKVANLIR